MSDMKILKKEFIRIDYTYLKTLLDGDNIEIHTVELVFLH